MKKDDRVFAISEYVLEIRERVFVSQTNSMCYLMEEEAGSVTAYSNKLVFVTKLEAQEYLITKLREKLSSRIDYDNRIVAAGALLDRIEKISQEFDLKKKEKKNE